MQIKRQKDVISLFLYKFCSFILWCSRNAVQLDVRFYVNDAFLFLKASQIAKSCFKLNFSLTFFDVVSFTAEVVVGMSGSVFF